MNRQRLPNRRGHEVFEFEHGGFRYRAGIGWFSDGRLAEIFLDCAKGGSLLAAMVSDAAIVASIALQYGASAQEIRHALSKDSLLVAVFDLLAGES